MLTSQQLKELIDRNIAKLPTFTTDKMSKTGVKWCRQTTRETITRLRADLKETLRQERA